MGRGGGLPESRPWGVLLLLGTMMSLVAAAAAAKEQETTAALGTIAFTTTGRTHFAHDVFGLKLPDSWGKDETSGVIAAEDLDEIRLTDGVSLNYNGQLVEGEARLAVLETLRLEGVEVADDSSVLVFVSERDGIHGIYFQIFSNEIQTTGESKLMLKRTFGHDPRRRELRENFSSKIRSAVLNVGLNVSLFDRPSVVGDNVVYVSTRENRLTTRQNWAAVYSTSLKSQTTTRLTPIDTADFSPSVSPSGEWVAATSESQAFQGEYTELKSDLYVYKAKDGSSRRLVMRHAGWPSWADDHTIFFHRRADDGWWSVFRIILPENFLSTGEGEVQEERITPAGVHAITPAASRTGKWVAVATRRPGSVVRHIEIFVLDSNSFVKLTEKISPSTSHYNPFVSSYSGFVGYHRCRGNSGGKEIVPLVEAVRSPIPGLALVRIDGDYPAYSPDGSLLAFIRHGITKFSTEVEDSGPDSGSQGVFVSNADGSGLRKVFPELAFSPSWDKKRKGVLYVTVGRGFGRGQVSHIIALHNVDGSGEVFWKNLTLDSANDAFPSASPDGKYVVFRSMRSGYKNLYIMDAVDGEEIYLRRLTEGPWTDDSPNWSPDGEWIIFTSNREDPGESRLHTGPHKGFAIYMIRPNGTGLHKVIQSGKGSGGMALHPMFSPDSKKFSFSTDLSGDSAEPVADPMTFRPFGEIFVLDVDGKNAHRLTHSSFEDGLSAWGPSTLSSSDLSTEGRPLTCAVEDTQWLYSDPDSN